MRIIAIDASRRRGVVTLSVEAAARAAEAAGAEVERVRLHDLEIRGCTGCGICGSSHCKIDDDLPELARRIAEADGLIFGTPAFLRRADEATAAILDRLGGYFTGLGAMPLSDAERAGRIRRAIIITATDAPEPIATFFGYSTGPIRALRRALGTGGIRTIGSLAMTRTWFGRLEVGEWENDKAASLGRVLAGKL